MRFTAVIPALLSAAALVLTFLCLFAGHEKDFMEDYNVFSLNVSRLGEGLVNNTLDNAGGTVGNLWDMVPENIQDNVGAAAGAVANELGIEDFYSAHLLDYCFGQYTPTEVPNDTVSASDISKNVTGCSKSKAMFWFNPTEILENALNESGVGVSLQDLNWPDDIQNGLDALRIVSVAAFVLYCIAIAVIFLTLGAAVIAIFANGRLSACVNLLLSIVAFLVIGIASALMTALIEIGGNVINEHANPIGVVATKGKKFMALTWVATALMFVTLIAWVFELCIGRRKHAYMPAKQG